MRMRTAMHLVKNPHVDSTMPVSPTKTAPLQPTSLQPNPSQLNPTQHNSTCLHPIRPTGAIPTLPNVPEDQASENRQPFIQPRVDMEVEMEMEMRVGERGSWSGAEHGVHWHMAGGSCIFATIPSECEQRHNEYRQHDLFVCNVCNSMLLWLGYSGQVEHSTCNACLACSTTQPYHCPLHHIATHQSTRN